MTKTKKCNCDLCQLHKVIRKTKKREHKAVLKRIFEAYEVASLDAVYYEAKYRGTWIDSNKWDYQI